MIPDKTRRKFGGLARWLNVKLVCALLIAIGGAVLGLSAWDRFETSSSPAPSLTSDHAIIIFTLPSNVKFGAIEYLSDPFERSTLKGYGDKFPGSNATTGTKADIIIRMTLNEARNTCVSISAKFVPDPAPVNALDTIGVDPDTAITPTITGDMEALALHEYALEVCPGGEGGPGGVATSDMKGVYRITRSGQAATSGYRMSANFPAIAVDRNLSPGAQFQIEATLVQVPPQVKLEAIQPAATATSGFGWKTNETVLQPGNMSLSSITGEVSASRSLFISAALIGLAGGLIPYVVELLISGISRRRKKK
ncbi:hypothetical protein [Amycolatopsis orientalis]|uniref:hypothetical protein n=1 Tax=Amycolatopsis orientalis TaxID=31958 RepID=UPI0012682B9C|nr:hypothetical protein [Amycolatopsis orientalis]